MRASGAGRPGSHTTTSARGGRRADRRGPSRGGQRGTDRHYPVCTGRCPATVRNGLGPPSRRTIRLLVPPVLRATEYGYLAVMGLASGVPGSALFVLLVAIISHHR